MRAIIRASRIVLLLVALPMLHISCEGVVYHSFQSTGEAWQKSDTLQYTFYNGDAAEYSVMVELCYNTKYPYRNLWIRREVDISSAGAIYIDTLCCELYDAEGRNNGATAGMQYQISAPEKCYFLQDGDTMNISLMHIMQDEVAEGITNVGVKISHPGRRRYGGN